VVYEGVDDVLLALSLHRRAEHAPYFVPGHTACAPRLIDSVGVFSIAIDPRHDSLRDAYGSIAQLPL
jgi:hypothetical protein